jgi:hypothetical protein
LRAIQQASDPEERRRRGQAALEFARGNFLKSASCGRFIEMLEKGNSSNKAGRPKTEILKTETVSAFLL